MKSKIQLSFLNTIILLRDFQENVIEVSREVPDSFFHMNLLAGNIYHDPCNHSYWQKCSSMVAVDGQEMYQEEYVDITRLLIENKKLTYELKKDPLTEIANVAALKEKEEEIVSSNKNCVIVMCDVNYFKQINDSFGHDMGDKVLKEIAKIFDQNRRNDHDLIARAGGDEFTFYFETENVSSIIEKMDIVQNEVKKLGKELNIPLSISTGISYFSSDLDLYKQNQDKLDQKKQEADQALYYVKENAKGTNCIAYFNPETRNIELYQVTDETAKKITKTIK